MDTPSYASYHGFELRAEPDAHADPIRRIKGWHPIVRDRDGRPLPDEINAPWLSQSEAEQRAVEVRDREARRQEAEDWPDWKYSS